MKKLRVQSTNLGTLDQQCISQLLKLYDKAKTLAGWHLLMFSYVRESNVGEVQSLRN